MECTKGFNKRIADDFRQKELLPVKVLFFVHMSTILVLYPYLTIHMRDLGINVEETAVMSALTPVVGIVMPPLAGLIADKIGNFKIMLALFSVFSGLSALLLLLVPIGRVTVTFPEQEVLGLSCLDGAPPYFHLDNQYPCTRTNNTFIKADFIAQSCGVICEMQQNATDENPLFNATYYIISTTNTSTGSVSTEELHLINETVFQNSKGVGTNHELLFNNEKYDTAIRKLGDAEYYFPSEFDDFTCKYSEKLQRFNCSTDRLFRGFSSFKGELKETTGSNNGHFYSLVGVYTNATDKRDAMCLPSTPNIAYSVTVGFGSSTEEAYNRLELQCTPHCIATAPRKTFCSNKDYVKELDISLTFWSYLLVRVFIGIIGGTAYTMFEGAVIAILREYKADYGLQRMYASIGGMISSPLSGLLVDYASRGKGYTDYRPIFFLYAGLKVASACLMLFINLEFKQPAKSVVADVKSIMNIELGSLFVAAFLLGSAWGYIESFLFWLLQDLGGTKSLMGLTITVGGILGIPLLALSGPIIKKFGHANIIFIGFLTYAVRLFGYSIIYNPWLSLIFESLECLTHSLCFTAAITYAARLSSVTTDTTVQGILGGLFYGVGKSAGSLVGGYLIKWVGMRGTFQIFSVVSAITAFVYLAFYHFYMKHHSSLTDDDETENEKQPDAVENSGKEKSADEINAKSKALYINDGYSVTEDAEKRVNESDA